MDGQLVNGGLKVPERILDFLARESTVTIATASPTGVPRAGSFLYVNDGPELFFWTRPNTTIARHIEQNPTVSFAIDAFDGDLGGLQGLQGMAECSVLLDGRRIAEVAAMFGEKYPTLAPGATMSISFFRVAPLTLQFVDNTAAGAAAPPGDFGASFHSERVYSVFAGLPSALVDAVSGVMLPAELAPGEVLANQGGPADKFFVVVEGELEVVRAEEDQEETVLATLGPGHFFGDVAILHDRPRTATVRATRESSVLRMDRAAFKQMVAQSLGATAEFDQVVRARLGADDDDAIA